jgi:curli biogenesis system outer membrane secretion channel CsgG
VFTRLNRCLLTLALLSPLFGIDAAAQSSKLRIAVLAFENNTTNHIFGDKLGEAASDELTTQLVKAGHFSVIERRQIQAILAEQGLGMSGAVDPATAAKVGKLLGAQLVAVGSITQFSMKQTGGAIGRLGVSASFAEAESKLDARLVNVNTGEILVVAEGDGKKRFGGAQYKDVNLERNYDAGVAQEALRPAIEKTVKKFVEQKDQLEVVGPAAPVMNVVGVREGQIYIDRGANAGLKVGQKLTVMRVTDTIKDARGNVLDEITEKVGVLEVVRVLSQSAICKVVEGSGVKEGDRVSN